MMTQEELGRSPLFDGISYESYQSMVKCFRIRTKSYRAGEVILAYGEGNGKLVGVVEEGQASLVRTDAGGNAVVLEQLGPGGVFGETVAFSGACGDSMMVVCDRDCRVEFIDYDQITRRCENACLHHSQLVQNMLRLISDKALALGERVEVLSQRSIRDKLLCYFSIQAAKQGSDHFSLPFSLSRLAEYISTDRSAMMREIKKMRLDGVAEVKNGEITLRH